MMLDETCRFLAVDFDKAASKGGVLGVRFISTEEDEIDPWLLSPSGKKPDIKIDEPLPEKVNIVLGNQVYISKENLPPVLKNRFPVILTERKEHLEILKKLLENKIEHLIVMKGGMGKKQRAAAKNALEEIPDNTTKAIFATGRYLGEGFDNNRLDTLFLTLPISWRGTLEQYAGRLHRIHDTKNEVQIYDYVDLEVPMLAKMYKRRQAGYRAIGYEITE